MTIKPIILTEPKYVSLTWDEFMEQYKPMPNHLVNESFGEQYMFETYGEELEFVGTLAEERRVWTFTEVEMGTGIYNGMHWVNRLGYFVTEVPWEEDTEYEVDLQRDVCDTCEKPFEDDDIMHDNGECGDCCEGCDQDDE